MHFRLILTDDCGNSRAVHIERELDLMDTWSELIEALTLDGCKHQECERCRVIFHEDEIVRVSTTDGQPLEKICESCMIDLCEQGMLASCERLVG